MYINAYQQYRMYAIYICVYILLCALKDGFRVLFYWHRKNPRPTVANRSYSCEYVYDYDYLSIILYKIFACRTSVSSPLSPVGAVRIAMPRWRLRPYSVLCNSLKIKKNKKILKQLNRFYDPRGCWRLWLCPLETRPRSESEIFILPGKIN